jgi:PadR family transcriptional regulator PadR
MLIKFMIRSRRPSQQMLALLRALAAQAPARCHGYDLMKATGLASGTIYPLLMRMTDQGLVVAEWRTPEQLGRPPRHAYRLTAAGLKLAADHAPDHAGKAPQGAPSPA